MRSLFALLTVGALLSGQAHAAKDSCPTEMSGSDGASLVPAYVTASNAFAWDLYGRLAFGSNDNLMYSPLSATFGLQAALKGAKGRTAIEIARVTRQLDLEKKYKAAQALIGILTPRGSKEVFEISNSIWSDSSRFSFHPDYERVMRAALGAECKPLRMAEGTALDDVNAYVSKKTHKMIPKLLSSLPANVVALLLNTLYFDGQFSSPFPERETKETAFRLPDGSVANVLMMHNSQTEAEYAETADHQILSLSFQKDDDSTGAFRADFVLPKGPVGLDQATYEGLVAKLTGTVVDAYVPKFNFDNNFRLKALLEAMGIRDMFHPAQADFSGMGQGHNRSKLYATDMIHGAAVEVKESGIRMAAGTAIPMGLERARGSAKVKFVADKPFYLLLRHAPTGAVTFMGQVTHPKYTAKPESKAAPESTPVAPDLGPVTPATGKVIHQSETATFRILTRDDEPAIETVDRHNASSWWTSSQEPKAKDWGKKISFGFTRKGSTKLAGLVRVIDVMHPEHWGTPLDYAPLAFPAAQGHATGEFLVLDESLRIEERAEIYRAFGKFAFEKLGVTKVLQEIDPEHIDGVTLLVTAGFKKVGQKRLPGGLGEPSAYHYYELNP